MAHTDEQSAGSLLFELRGIHNSIMSKGLSTANSRGAAARDVLLRMDQGAAVAAVGKSGGRHLYPIQLQGMGVDPR